jgi:5-methylcytosine-specific restriction enzyme A
MTKLSDIEPKEKPNVIDLLVLAGVDVSDWANCNTYPSRNPKYCYEWAFVEPKKVVVLNLWHHYMEEKDGGIIMRNLNLREDAKKISEPSRAHRAQIFDEAIQTALKDKLPIRVIVQVGKPPGTNDTVVKRALDPVQWSITAYEWKTGKCILTRGAHEITNSKAGEENAIDDLGDAPDGNEFPDRAKIVTRVIKRDNKVRQYVLRRAKGKCEYCDVRGFPTVNGGFYIETHHIIALGNSGRDTVDNVIALCPQHHRQAHYGKDAESLESEFAKILAKLNRKT